jgi:transposase
MANSRRKFTAEQKADIVRRHLKGKEPISAIAEELSLQPTQIHQWVAMALEQVERAFEKTAKSDKASKMSEAKINALKKQPIRRLQEKLIHKNEVIA